MSHQLDVWRGQFGREYTDRNVVDWRVRVPAFRQALDRLEIRRVLEVGCNRAHNLQAISHLLGSDAQLVGIEPNRYAAELAHRAGGVAGVVQGQAFHLPVRNEYFDLVFTAGVLIHLPADALPAALSEFVRVTRRFVLAIEYFASLDTAVHYRGHDNLLWKRNFLGLFQAQFPELVLRRSGSWTREMGFDGTSWWLLEKVATS